MAFSLKVKLEDQPQWINALGDFYTSSSERVDALVMSKLRPLLHYARRDIDNYRTSEEICHPRSILPF